MGRSSSAGGRACRRGAGDVGSWAVARSDDEDGKSGVGVGGAASGGEVAEYLFAGSGTGLGTGWDGASRHFGGCGRSRAIGCVMARGSGDKLYARVAESWRASWRACRMRW